MVLKGKWVCSKEGRLIQINENTSVGTILSPENEELFLRVNGQVFDPDDLGYRNQAFLKSFFDFLRTAGISNDCSSLSQGVYSGDIPLTRTALHSLIDFMLFDGDYENIPNYIKEAL